MGLRAFIDIESIRATAEVTATHREKEQNRELYASEKEKLS